MSRIRDKLFLPGSNWVNVHSNNPHRRDGIYIPNFDNEKLHDIYRILEINYYSENPVVFNEINEHGGIKPYTYEYKYGEFLDYMIPTDVNYSIPSIILPVSTLIKRGFIDELKELLVELEI
jgi:hypothetical protein